jgi:hypothetical protein
VVAPSILISPTGLVSGAGVVPLRGIPSSLSLSGGVITVNAPLTIPVNPVPSQTLQVTLSGQTCQINIYAKDIWIPDEPPPGIIVTDPQYLIRIQPVFLDLLVNDVLVLGGVLCVDRTLLVIDAYLGFVGDLGWIDSQGTSDPQWSGLGSRWLLNYFPTL